MGPKKAEPQNQAKSPTRFHEEALLLLGPTYRPSSSKETGRRLRHRRQAQEDLASCETSSSLRSDWEVQMQLTHEHEELRRTYRRVIEEEINPHVNEWEAAQIFPAHEVFKKLGRLGLLGVTKPVEYGGLGLDYSYGAIIDETSQYINCGGIPMAIGVQTRCLPGRPSTLSQGKNLSRLSRDAAHA
jgi:hypothetical protein